MILSSASWRFHNSLVDVLLLLHWLNCLRSTVVDTRAYITWTNLICSHSLNMRLQQGGIRLVVVVDVCRLLHRLLHWLLHLGHVSIHKACRSRKLLHLNLLTWHLLSQPHLILSNHLLLLREDLLLLLIIHNLLLGHLLLAIELWIGTSSVLILSIHFEFFVFLIIFSNQ